MGGKSLQGHSLGRQGETIATRALRLRGYRIVERNYRCRLGEIDLIARGRGRILFVEVKTRLSRGVESLRELVSYPKQRRVSLLAQHYLATSRPDDGHSPAASFAVVLVDLSGSTPQVEVIEDAFDLRWGY